MATIVIVYTDDQGHTFTEQATCPGSAIIRQEELEAAGYRVIHD